jgi:hypothetical protein
MDLRKALIGIVGGAVLSVSSLAGATSAQAASAQPDRALCTHPCSSPPGPGWRYIDNYFWASSCIEVGNRGINNHSWNKYQCDGGTWTNYDLWVL